MKTVNRWVLYLLGMLVLALGLTLNTKAGLGVSPIISIAFAVSEIWGWNFGDMTFLLYSLFVAGQFVLRGKNSRLTDLLQLPLSLAFSRVLNLYSALIPYEAAEHGFLANFGLLLAAIFFTGAGAAITVNMKLVPNPGDGIVAAVAERLGRDQGFAKNLFDVGCVAVTCVLGLLAKAFVVDGVIEGINVRKKVTIVSRQPDKINEFIMGTLHRGATVYTAHGAFSGRDEQVITTVLNRREAVSLRNYIRRTDPGAFITIVNSIQFVGVSMIIYLAGLQTLDQSVMEAASLDGASGWKKFWNITLPMLQPAFTTSVVLNLIGGLKLFDIIKVLTNGGPGYATNSISTYISSMYFDAQNAGYASALGVFLFILIAIITYLLNTGLAKLNWEA